MYDGRAVSGEREGFRYRLVAFFEVGVIHFLRFEDQRVNDEDLSSGTDSEDTRRDTVLISDGNREENGLVRQTIPPVYRGAIIVCQGGNDAKVRLSIVEAVMSVTGLRSDCITVLKMK